MATRSQANKIAAAFFLLALLVILIFAERQGDFSEPRTTTTVEKETVPAPPARKVTTAITFTGGQRTGATRTIEVQAPPAGPGVESTTTTETEPRSFFERVLGDDLLKWAIALLGAFLTAAAIQRVLLGRYGGFKVAGVEVQEIAEATAEAQKKLPAEIAAAIGEAAAKLRDEARNANRDLRLELARLFTMIVELEKRTREGSADHEREEVAQAQQHAERLLREALAPQQAAQTAEQIAAELGAEERLRQALAKPIDRLERLSGG